MKQFCVKEAEDEAIEALAKYLHALTYPGGHFANGPHAARFRAMALDVWERRIETAEADVTVCSCHVCGNPVLSTEVIELHDWDCMLVCPACWPGWLREWGPTIGHHPVTGFHYDSDQLGSRASHHKPNP